MVSAFSRLLKPLLAGALLVGLCATSVHAQIRIGQPSGFTGAVATGVKENTDGAKLYIEAVNERGGVNGQKIELISLDDKFDPKQTVERARELLDKHQVIALFMNRGTPHSQALLPLITERRIPLIAPSTGAMVLHEPVHPFVFNVRAPYQRESERAVAYLATIGITRIVMFVSDDSFGEDAAAGAMRGFEAAGLKPLLYEKIDRSNADFAAVARKSIEHRAQAVLLFTSARNTAMSVKALREAGSTAQVITLSNNASGGFIQLLGEHSRGVIVTQVFPNERSVAVPMVKEALGFAKAKGLDEVTPAMLEGYAGAKVLVEGLRRAGPNPTPARLVQALESFRKVDIGGMEVTYSPTNRSGLFYVDMSIIDQDGKFRR